MAARPVTNCRGRGTVSEFAIGTVIGIFAEFSAVSDIRQGTILIACHLAPAAKDYLFLSHRSQEIGHATMVDLLGLEPILDLKMRLGEGTGSVLAMKR